MINVLFVFGAIFLGWSLGRNNLSNIFGNAIGTRMISLKTGMILASIFVFLGVIISGGGTTEHINKLATVSSFLDAFFICVSAGIVIYLLGLIGIPASITQTSTGALLALNIFNHLAVDTSLVVKSFLGWVYTPFLSGTAAFILFYILKFLLKKYPIKLLNRDLIVRGLLVCVGAFSAYSLGANNIASIAGPYISVNKSYMFVLFLVTSISVAVGFFCADRKVIKTVGKELFPLSPLESFVVVFSSAATLFCFSSVSLKNFLSMLSLPSFPLIPVPLSEAVIGSIVAIALAKGIDGLKLKIVGQVVCSWFAAPLSSGLFCYLFLMVSKIIKDSL